MIIDALKDAILQNLGPLRPAPKNWNKRHCPLCHTQGHGRDTRNRFGIQFNTDSIALNCFNCGFSAGYSEGKELSKSFKFFLSQINIDDKFIKAIDFEIFKQRNQIQVLHEGDEEKIEDPESKFRNLFQKWHTVDLPQDSLSIEEWLNAGLDDPEFLNVVNYLLGRSLFNIGEFYWSPSTEFNLNQRFIIPYKYNGRIVGFTSRLYYEVPDKSTPKYYQQCPPDFVYNIDNQQAWARKYTIVTEGVLDAYVVDGVSILGEVGQSKVDIINRLQKQIIVCPDRDKKGSDLVQVAVENQWAVAFPKWPAGIKDAAAASTIYGRLLTTYSIISSAVTGKLNITNKWEIAAAERARQKTYD